MTVTAGRRWAANEAVYVEPARSYASALVLFLLLCAGFVLGVAFGAGLAHVIGWAIAAVLIVGVDVWLIRAARSVYSITVTAQSVRVGDDSVEREQIVGVTHAIDPQMPVLGRRAGQVLRRGIALRLADGTSLALSTRHPQRLAAALGVAADALQVRHPDPDELAALPQIEQRADALFRVTGLDLPPRWSTEDELRAAKAVLVAGRPPVGLVRIEEVDALAHIELLAVVPNRMRQGIGTALLDAACVWARERGYPAITLTTFAEVAWNAPFYAARGFVELAELSPELAELRDWERAEGLDAAGRRIAMRRELR